MYQQLRRRMIELVGAHRLDEANLVQMLFNMRQPVRDPVTTLTKLVKGILRTQKFGNSADEGEALAGQERRGTILTIEPFQVGFVLE